MKNPLALSRDDAAKLKSLARRYGIELVILFGSRARGRQDRIAILTSGCYLSACLRRVGYMRWARRWPVYSKTTQTWCR